MNDFIQHHEENKLAGRAALLMLLAGLLLIFYSTLKPFDFHYQQITARDYIAGYEILSSSFLDFARNIVLFLPVGFALAALLDQRGWSRRRILTAVFLSGFLLTLTVESLQQFLTLRQPSVGDLVSNTLGALAGLGVYRLWQNRKQLAVTLKEAVTVPRNLLAAMAVYVFLLLAMAFGLSASVRLYDWESDYGMLIGNEPQGNRPWLGSVRDLQIFDKAMPPELARKLLESPDLVWQDGENLLAYYPLVGDGVQADLTGRNPAMIWKSATVFDPDEDSSQGEEYKWLESETSVRSLSEQLLRASQLSVRLSAATADLEQVGPARMVTISESPLLRNLTIGQQEEALAVRFRSWMTGKNGTYPQIMFPGLFTDLESLDLVLTYDGLTMTLFDSRSASEQTVEMVPGIVFFERYIYPVVDGGSRFVRVRAGAVTNWSYRLLFYTIVLFPFGVLVSFDALKVWSRRHRFIPLLCALLGIPLLLEWALVVRSGSGLRPANVVTSFLTILFIAGVLLPVAGRVWRRLQAARPRQHPLAGLAGQQVDLEEETFGSDVAQ